MPSQKRATLSDSSRRGARAENVTLHPEGQRNSVANASTASRQHLETGQAPSADPTTIVAQRAALGFLLAAAARCSVNGSSARCPGSSELWNELSAHYGSHAMQRVTALSTRRRRAPQDGKRAWLLISASALQGRYLCASCGAWLIRRRCPFPGQKQKTGQEGSLPRGVSAKQRCLVCPLCVRVSFNATASVVHHRGSQTPSPSSLLASATCEKKPCRRKRCRKSRAVGAKKLPSKLPAGDANESSANAPPNTSSSTGDCPRPSAPQVPVPTAKRAIGALRRRVTVNLDAPLAAEAQQAIPASAPSTSSLSGRAARGGGRAMPSAAVMAASDVRNRMDAKPAVPPAVKSVAKHPAGPPQSTAKSSSSSSSGGNLWDSLGL